MLVYPQLTTGVVTQFPVELRRILRTVSNVLADGRSIRLADPYGEVTQWQLHYQDLSDQEASTLEVFFESTEGSLGVFTFLDPTGNLFSWSNHLDHSGWNKGPLLELSRGLDDPAGGNNGWRVFNPTAAGQSLTQILEAPGAYTYCLSLYAKSDTPGAAVTLLRGGVRAARAVRRDWGRLTLSGSGEPSAETIEFGIEVPPGGSLDVFGMQVEPQIGASAYKPSRLGDIYPRAWFRDDFLALAATDVNRHAATVNILHAIRL